ncbi:MAG TPA: hypothetical protein VK918_00730, partial [Pyrinomonadaceae bacterium]|nr:hypothetical protein [Pyrinomonadaceae bacterium]
PQDSIKWAKNIFRARIPASSPSALRRIVALLHVDLLPGRQAFGERSAGATNARQMLFQAEDAAVDLRITDLGKSLSIRGQVIGDGFENAVASLSGPSGTTSASLDENSEFEFTGTKKGVFRLSISGNASEIVIEEVDLS